MVHANPLICRLFCLELVGWGSCTPLLHLCAIITLNTVMNGLRYTLALVALCRLRATDSGSHKPRAFEWQRGIWKPQHHASCISPGTGKQNQHRQPCRSLLDAPKSSSELMGLKSFAQSDLITIQIWSFMVARA
jgi:hypothetical protein